MKERPKRPSHESILQACSLYDDLFRSLVCAGDHFQPIYTSSPIVKTERSSAIPIRHIPKKSINNGAVGKRSK